MKFNNLKLILLLLCIALLQRNSGFAQGSSVKNHAPQKWMATFMTGGANSSTTRHFIRLSDGRLMSFAPGDEPEPVNGIDHVKAIAASSFHILALKDDGTVWAWGNNDDGQLAQPTSLKHSNAPVQINGIKNAIDISATGSESYALLADGTIMAWGKISHNGWSTIKQWDKPTKLPGITDGIALAGSMVLLSDGGIMAWGDGNWGQLGNDATNANVNPVKVKGITNAVAIAAGDETRMALLSDGTIKTWGKNNNGILGNGLVENTGSPTMQYSTTPVQVKNISNAKVIDMNASGYAVLHDGTIRGWGWGQIGALGSKRSQENPLPVKIPDVQNVVAIYPIKGGCFALLADGTLVGWGSDMVATGTYRQVYKAIKITSLGDLAPKD